MNNAARVIDKPALELTEADWDAVLDVNLKGAFLCSQHAARLMLAQDDGGVILNIGASTGIRGRRNGVNTCASKAGLMIMTQCLALELAPRIRVNTIVPGLVVTTETAARFGLGDPAVRRAREEATPLQRLGQPEDIADAVMLLLSPEAEFITGQKLVVDGGQNMWLRRLMSALPYPCAYQRAMPRQVLDRAGHRPIVRTAPSAGTVPWPRRPISNTSRFVPHFQHGPVTSARLPQHERSDAALLRFCGNLARLLRFGTSCS